MRIATGLFSFSYPKRSTEWWTRRFERLTVYPPRWDVWRVRVFFAIAMAACGSALWEEAWRVCTKGKIDHFSQSDGLSSDSVSAIFQDREGKIWVGTHAGLDRFRELPITPFYDASGILEPPRLRSRGVDRRQRVGPDCRWA